MQLHIEESNLLCNLLQNNGIDLKGKYFNSIVFKIFSPKNFFKLELCALKEARAKIEELFLDRTDVIKIQCCMDEILLLLFAENEIELIQLQEKYLNKLLEIMKSYHCLKYFGGIGKPVNCIENLHLSFYEASRAFVYRFIWDCSLILDYRQIPDTIDDISGIPCQDMKGIANFDKKKVASFLHNGCIDEVPMFVTEYLKSIGKTNMDSFLFRQYIVLDSYFITTNYMEEMCYDGGIIEKPLGESAKMMLSVLSFDFMNQYLIRIFTQGMALRNEYQGIYKI